MDYIYKNPTDILGIFLYLGLLALFFFFPLILGIYFFASFGGNKKYDKSFEPSLSIIVPSKDESLNLKRTLDSIFANDYPLEKIEVLAIISGSTDDSESICQQFIDDNKSVRILNKELEKRGKPAALNYGVSEVKNEILVFYDAGNILLKDTLHNLVAPLRNKENSAVIGSCRVENWKKNKLTKGIALEYTELVSAAMNFEIFQRLGRKIWIYGKNWATYKTVLEEVGGFDENALTEDLQISVKLVINNKKIVFTPYSVVYDKVPENWKALKKERLRWIFGFRLDSVDVMKYNKRAFNTVIRRNFAMMHYGHMAIWAISSIVFVFIFWLISDFYLMLVSLTTLVFTFGTLFNSVRKYGDKHYSLLLYTPVFFVIAFHMFQSQLHLPKQLEWAVTK